MSTKKVFNSPYAHTRASGYKPSQPSLTQQQFKSDTEINTIVHRMQRNEFVNSNIKTPTFGQTFKPNQYEQAIVTIRDAQNQFNSLPSHIRNRFKNNPSEYLKFVQSNDNLDEAIELGLVDTSLFDDDMKSFYDSKDYKLGIKSFKNDFFKTINQTASTGTTVTPDVVNEPATH